MALILISKTEAKKEVIAAGGLRVIFAGMIQVLEQENFEFNLDTIDRLEYHCNIDRFSLFRFTIRKTINEKEPYLMQLEKVRSGIVVGKTIPWIVTPKYSPTQYLDFLMKMKGSIQSTNNSDVTSLKESKIRSENRSKWQDVISEPNVTPEYKFIFKEFLMKDDIAFETFAHNFKAGEIVQEFLSVEIWEGINNLGSDSPQPSLKMSKTFKEHFASNKLNRAMGIPDWFYAAYPDVVVWLQENMATMEAELAEYESIFISDDGPTANFFRYIVDKFKVENGKLECSIDLG